MTARKLMPILVTRKLLPEQAAEPPTPTSFNLEEEWYEFIPVANDEIERSCRQGRFTAEIRFNDWGSRRECVNTRRRAKKVYKYLRKKLQAHGYHVKRRKPLYYVLDFNYIRFTIHVSFKSNAPTIRVFPRT